jgi:DNA-binding NarL/FixJ family response regulator
MGLKVVLECEPDMEVVAEAGDLESAVDAFERHRPDLTLLDLRMPGGGLTTLKRIRALCSEARVLILTTSEQEEDVHGCLESGARGYALKSMEPAGLAGAIRAVLAGELWMPVEVERIRLARQSSPSLSQREQEVLELMAKGLTNPEIGELLTLSRSTIKVHVAHILEKLGVADRTEAAAEAYRRGLLG